ncbi:hypothetical protein BJF78_20195 [Pseudonocardia sp. CNS-139]|nr:hypothetical protein BJF78_20195 [Pseudonocardia sp. CNS-139]
MSPTGAAPPSRPHREDDGPSAGELSAEAILRERAAEPATGWRRALLKATGGLVNPGPSQAEVQRRELLHRIRTPLIRSHRIAVSSIKGGVGKTTVTALLGLVMAENRATA